MKRSGLVFQVDLRLLPCPFRIVQSAKSWAIREGYVIPGIEAQKEGEAGTGGGAASEAEDGV